MRLNLLDNRSEIWGRSLRERLGSKLWVIYSRSDHSKLS